MAKGQLIVVGCGKAKIWKKRRRLGKVAAKDAYAGSLFKLARRYAERHSTRWMILSAKYGLLHPETLISNYDVTVGSSGAITPKRIRSQWRRSAQNARELACLASKKYVELLIEALPESVNVQMPLNGMNLFQRTRWLKEHSEANKLT